MNLRSLCASLTIALTATACAGGGSSPSPVTGSGSNFNTQLVHGTLAIGGAAAAAVSNSSRFHRDFVSAATSHVGLYIDQVATAATSSTTTCTATTGTGTACTITWSAQLTVPASHTFNVEIDNGTKILGEGSGVYPIVAGTNTLGTLSINGVANNATFTVTSCTSSSCSGNVTLSDAALNAIAYTGTTVVPTTGKSPTSGNVYDNGPITFTSSTPASGTVSGTAQTGTGSNVFSTYASGTLTVTGVDTTGVYTYAVTCASGATGTFGITVGNGSSLVGITSPAYTATVATTVTAPLFTCTAGVISSATGTLPIN